MKLSLDDLISTNFKLGESVWLHKWQIYCFPGPEIYTNILSMAATMEKIRHVFSDRKIYVTSWYRPPLYNAAIKGAITSLHLQGLAVDFTVDGLTPDQVRAFLRPLVKQFNIRMEDVEGLSWVHVDMKPVQSDNERLFKI